MKYARIVGTGSYFPRNVLTNADLEKMVDTSDQWIVERTGMHTRHISSEDETTTMMAHQASVKALEMAGMRAEELDGIIFATCTPDYCMPSSGAILGKLLDVSGPFAFDLNTACSGYLYAQHMANGLIKSGQCKKILIAASERLSTIVDYTDRSTCILLGDAAGAVVMTADSEPGVRGSIIRADGHYDKILYMHGSGSIAMSKRNEFDINANLFKMQGNETFKLAVKNMVETTIEAVRASWISASEIDYLVPHQANIRIIEAVAKRFKISMDNVMINLDRRGNCSAATIPTALDEGICDGRIKRGTNIAMTAFGGGMSWGSAIVTL